MRALKKFLKHHETALAFGVVVVGAGAILFGISPPSVTCIHGDMRWRYAAQVPAAISDVHLDAARINVGFGAAAIGEWDGLGDALAVGGQVFVRHTHRRSPRFYQSTANRYFQSNAFVYVPAARLADAYYNVGAATTIEKLLASLLREYPDGAIASGALRFDLLRTIAMSMPATAGKPVLFHTAAYYTRPMEQAKDTWGYIVLIAAPAETSYAAVLPPSAARTALAGHALALRLRDAPERPGIAPAPENVSSVGQVLKDSIATEGQLAIYPIERIVGCADAKAEITAPTR